MQGFLISAEKCPECGEMAVFPFSRLVKATANRWYGLLSMKCSKCEWVTDEKEDLRAFKKWLDENEVYFTIDASKEAE